MTTPKSSLPNGSGRLSRPDALPRDGTSTIGDGSDTVTGNTESTGTVSGLAALRRFAIPPSPEAGGPPGEAAAERCELCGERLGPEHPHLVDLRQRSIGCACPACALLFTRRHSPGRPAPDGRPGGRYRTIPDRVRTDPGSPLTEAEWAQLAIPVAIAFFFVNSDLGRVVASYPSPAGVTECELDLAAWDRLAAAHPLLRAPEPDVEAILVMAKGGNKADEWPIESATAGPMAHSSGVVETFLVPIDVCYSLAGALRLDWHGFDGGPEVRRLLSGLLADLRRRARPLEPAPG